jgi:type II secretory pathway component PulF
VAQLSDKVKSEVAGTLMAAIIGLSIALVMLIIFPIFSAAKLQEIYKFIPLEAWGKTGKGYLKYVENVKEYSLYVLAVVAVILAWVQWSVNNWTGAARDWSDRNIVLYRAIRDIKGALFLATMSTLTRRRGNVMFTLRESLSVFASSVRSKWLRWRVEEIMEMVDITGATTSDAFSTNLLSQEMFFFLRDTQEARGFADGFSETGKYVEGAVVKSLVKRITVYRWALLFVGLMCVIGVMGWQFAVMNEMKGAMQLYYSSK